MGHTPFCNGTAYFWRKNMISNSSATHAKVAIYIRVSTLHQIDRDSLPMQRHDLIAYAKLILNTDDVTIFEDAGYSGKNTIRPEFQKMMSQLRTGTYTHLLVWKIDRISRNLLDFAEMYQELKRPGRYLRLEKRAVRHQCGYGRSDAQNYPCLCGAGA